LSQLVKRLREALDPPARRMANDPAYESVETIRSVGYRLNG
jgi:DNA-binding response OmpR family regulator